MKKILVAISCFLLVNLASAQEIPKWKIDDVLTLIDTSSTPMVVNFWATWCQPCVHEIPWFEKAVAAYRDSGIKLVLVSLDFRSDYDNGRLRQFVKKAGYSSSVVWLNETNADRFCPPIDSAWGGAIPATLMVNNKTGYRKFFEFQLKEERLKLELQKLVE
ncbi:MAG TPA: TlpA disulfide reductase family protein [Chitinophagaceae bacterium]